MFINMKRIIYISTLLLLILSGCKKEDPAPGPKDMLCGEWHSYTLPVDADIYAQFSSEGSFKLYQKIGEGPYLLYSGSWSMEGNVISGKYEDGTDWAASYDVIFSDKFMTWTSRNDAAEESQYERSSIPDEVKENSQPQ